MMPQKRSIEACMKAWVGALQKRDSDEPLRKEWYINSAPLRELFPSVQTPLSRKSIVSTKEKRLRLVRTRFSSAGAPYGAVGTIKTGKG